MVPWRPELGLWVQRSLCRALPPGAAFCSLPCPGARFLHPRRRLNHLKEIDLLLTSSHSTIKWHIRSFYFPSLSLNVCCCLVAQQCPLLCSPMDCSMPGSPLFYYFPEFVQINVHCVGDAIQPSHPLPPFSYCLQSFPASGSFPMYVKVLFYFLNPLMVSYLYLFPLSLNTSMFPKNRNFFLHTHSTLSNSLSWALQYFYLPFKSQFVK